MEKLSVVQKKGLQQLQPEINCRHNTALITSAPPPTKKHGTTPISESLNSPKTSSQFTNSIFVRLHLGPGHFFPGSFSHLGTFAGSLFAGGGAWLSAESCVTPETTNGATSSTVDTSRFDGVSVMWDRGIDLATNRSATLGDTMESSCCCLR